MYTVFYTPAWLVTLSWVLVFTALGLGAWILIYGYWAMLVDRHPGIKWAAFILFMGACVTYQILTLPK